MFEFCPLWGLTEIREFLIFLCLLFPLVTPGFFYFLVCGRLAAILWVYFLERPGCFMVPSGTMAVLYAFQLFPSFFSLPFKISLFSPKTFYCFFVWCYSSLFLSFLIRIRKKEWGWIFSDFHSLPWKPWGLVVRLCVCFIPWASGYGVTDGVLKPVVFPLASLSGKFLRSLPVRKRILSTFISFLEENSS